MIQVDCCKDVFIETKKRKPKQQMGIKQVKKQEDTDKEYNNANQNKHCKK
jgi:hypothetical protein